MAKLFNLARMTTATTGTGTITLGSAVSSYLTFALAGVSDGDVVDYAIKDGSDSEIGSGVYTSSGTTLTRVVKKSTNSDAAISLSGTAEVFITPSAETLNIERNRQNMALTNIYQSKSIAEYRRLVNFFATGFKGASDTLNGVDTANSSGFTTNATGYLAQTVSGTTVTINSADGTAGIQGLTMVDLTTKVLNGVVVAQIGEYSATARSVTVKIVKRNSANNYDVIATETFSHTGGGWEYATLTSPYTVPASGDYYLAAYVPSGGSTPNVKLSASRARYSGDMTGTGQTTIAEETGQLYPLRYVHSVTISNMTLRTALQTADSSVSNGRVLIEFDNAGSPTLDTDLTAEVTCNGGTNWTPATLKSATSNSQGGRKVVETVEVACTAGTSFAMRVKTLNNKSVPIYGVQVEVR